MRPSLEVLASESRHHRPGRHRQAGGACCIPLVEGPQSRCELLSFRNPTLPPFGAPSDSLTTHGKVGDFPWECWGELGRINGEKRGESGRNGEISLAGCPKRELS